MAQLALKEANIAVDTYIASEIDKYALAVTEHRFPNTLQVGDVEKVDGKKFQDIDLLIGGSPCTGFSIAGKQLNFADDRSRLFFEFVRLLNEIKPKYFLLENVKMKQEYQDVISRFLGVQPIEINSAKLSAQNRRRLYWTNIPNIKQPEDMGLTLKDIIQDGMAGEKRVLKTVRNKRHLRGLERKGLTATATMYKGAGNNGTTIIPVQGCIQVGEADLKGHDLLKRVYSIEGKGLTVTANSGGNQEPKISEDLETWRKLTPLEVERLQTVPDEYTLVPFGKRMMSTSRRYQLLGNGFTVKVISHILKNMEF